MESYCVIQFKDKQERGKILHFLAIETEAEYKVTADLKGFVAKQFNVTILENVVVSPTDIDTVAINKTNVENTVDVAPPAVDALQYRQQSTQSSSIPVSIVVDQPIPVIDKAQNLLSMEDYGTYVPYLERPVEPKQEIMEDIEDMEVMIDMNAGELIGDDNVDNISINDVLMQNQGDTPSPTMKRRFGKSTKRPRHAIDEDYDEEDTAGINNSKKARASVEVTRGKTKKSVCKKCGNQVNSYYSGKIEHAIFHADIMNFECLVNGCGSKYKTHSHIIRHMTSKHKNQSNAFRKIELTSEQNDELNSIMKECFNDLDENNGNSCQVCHQNIGGISNNSFASRRDHALHHVNFMMYTCTDDRCSFESKTTNSMKTHLRNRHPKIINPTLTKIKLTTEQKLEIEEMYVKCFPKLDKDGSAT